MTQESKPVYTEATLLDALVEKFNLTFDIELDIKDIIDDAKDQGNIDDVALIKTIAKAKAYNKLSDLEDKATKQLNKIKELA